VCMDANKPKSVYSSHSVKQNGVVVCPTLLAQECRYCHKKGHTVKFCATLEKENAKQKKTAEKIEDKKIEEKKTKPTVQNMFTLLDDDDDQDEDDQSERVVEFKQTNVIAAALNGIAYVKEEYPALSANGSANVIAPALSGIAPALGGYASALKTQPIVKTQPAKQEPSAYRFKFDSTQKKSWANCSDSEDEEEDKEEKIESNCAW
jgi:hypothetical protein